MEEELRTIRELVEKDNIISRILQTGKIPENWNKDYEPTGQERIRTRMSLGTKIRQAKKMDMKITTK